MIPVDDPTYLSRLFHLNSEPWLNENAYRGSPYQQEFRDHPESKLRVALPETLSDTVMSLAAARVSTRAYSRAPLPLDNLASMLRAAYGIVGMESLPGGGAFLRRSVPSAGGLYPLELYILAARVTGLAPGIYHLDPRDEALELVLAGDWSDAAADCFYTWPFILDAPAVVCFATVFSRTQKKYGPRGYRYILLEAGHAAQNLLLTAQSLNLATLCMGGFRDSHLNRLLRLASPDEGVVYAAAVGMPA
jgi:SagB-type dehydrogenase family enzyme